MKKILILILGSFIATAASTEIVNFDNEKPGTIPTNWTAGVTGRGAPQWAIEADAAAPSKPNILKQSGQGDFPWCVKTDASLSDGFVQVIFKSISGKNDQAGGVVWRWKDKDNYYVARANALENNVSLYYTEKGIYRSIKYVDAPVAPNAWHLLRVDFKGAQITVSLDGKAYIELEDYRIAGAGKVGVWTKADSVIAFDEFIYGTLSNK